MLDGQSTVSNGQSVHDLDELDERWTEPVGLLAAGKLNGVVKRQLGWSVKSERVLCSVTFRHTTQMEIASQPASSASGALHVRSFFVRAPATKFKERAMNNGRLFHAGNGEFRTRRTSEDEHVTFGVGLTQRFIWKCEWRKRGWKFDTYVEVHNRLIRRQHVEFDKSSSSSSSSPN